MPSLPAHDARAVAVVEAIRRGDIESLCEQLQTDPGLARTRIIDEKGVSRTLLHVAADWPGHFPRAGEAVAALAAAGAEVTAAVLGSPNAAETALHWAASSGDVAVLDALLDCGADIEAAGAIFTGGAAMSDAVIFAQWPAARRLLERGAETTLWQAAALGLLDSVAAQARAAPPEQLTNALWHACRGGQLRAAQYLIERGANPHWVGHDGKTPLDVARESGAAALVEWLEAQR